MLISGSTDATTYKFEASATSIGSVPIDVAGDTVEKANDLGLLSESVVTRNEFIGDFNGLSLDYADFYRFELAENSTVDLKLTGLTNGSEIELYGNDGVSRIARYPSGSSGSTVINRALRAGTYYVRVNGYSGATYQIEAAAISLGSIPEDTAGDSVNKSKDLGILSSNSISINDSVGDFNGLSLDYDYYKFILSNDGSVELKLSDLNDEATLQLYGNDGTTRIAGSTSGSSTDTKISRFLHAGTYYARVTAGGLFSSGYGIATSYKFDASVEYSEDESYSPFSTAINIGIVEETTQTFVGEYPSYYKFIVTNDSTVKIKSSGLGYDGFIELYNGFQLVGKGYNPTSESGRSELSLDLRSGIYYVRAVNRDTSSYEIETVGTPLVPVPTDNAGEKIETARNLGFLQEDPITAIDFVGISDELNTDPRDYYKFQVSELSSIAIKITGLSKNVYVGLYSNDGVTLLADASTSAFEDLKIEQKLRAGTYYLQLYSYAPFPNSVRGGTSYQLEASAISLGFAPIDTAGERIDTARDLGILSTDAVIIDEFIGTHGGLSSDSLDYYKFELTEPGVVNIELSSLTGDAYTAIYSNDGSRALTRSGVSGDGTSETYNLKVGIYYLLIANPYGEGTTYQLKSSLVVEDGAGETLDTARDIGVLSNLQTFTDSVGIYSETIEDAADIYRFELKQKSAVQFLVENQSEDQSILLTLMNSEGRTLKTQDGSDALNTSLDLGEYYLKISSNSRGRTYRFKAEGISVYEPFENDTFEIDTFYNNLGNLKESRTISNFVGDVDPNDFWSFSLENASQIRLNLTIKGDADSVTISLLNSDGVQLESSPTAIEKDLEAGRYAVQVSGIGSNFYDLTLFSTEIDQSKPDLVVTDISVIKNAFAGEIVELVWIVSNQGNKDAQGTWTDSVYLSSDENVGGDQSYGSFEFTGVIAAGTSVERRQTVTLAEDLTGDRYFVVRTDSTNQIAEGEREDNNTTIDDQPISVTLAYPDLEVSGVTVPATAFSGQETVIQWTVTNNGSMPTEGAAWSDSVWLSVDDELDSTDINLGSVVNASDLKVGESYRNELVVNLPQEIQGNYRFLVRTDSGEQVTELRGEAGNIGVSSLTKIDLTPPPDLQVTAVNAPSQGFSGQLLSLTWTVTNEGRGRTLQNRWFDEIIMSTDESIDEDDYRLGGEEHIGALDIGGSYTVTREFSLPEGVSGNVYFFIRTNASNLVLEGPFAENNTGYDSTPTFINLKPPADLEVEAVTVPSSARTGENLTIDYRVTNFGATETENGSWTDTFYLSEANTLDVDTAVRLGSVNHFGKLEPSESYNRSVSFALSNQISGEYFVFVVTDSSNRIFELDNANNVTASLAPVVIASLPADLIVSNINVTGSPEAGKALQVEWTVNNQGAGSSIQKSWRDRIIVSRDAELGNADDIQLFEYTHNGLLGAGEAYTRKELVQVPFELRGNYNLFVVTDSGDGVYEATDNNNFLAKPITIAQQTPDLQVTKVNSESVTGLAGEALTVSWTVENLGNAKTNTDVWYDKVYLSTDPNGANEAFSLGTFRRTNAITASGQYSASKTFTVPLKAVGNFYVVVRTDTENSVIEANGENNNVGAAVSATSFGANPNPNPNLIDNGIPPEFSPDLVVTNISTPVESISGQSFELGWTVENQRYATGDRTWYDAVYLSRDRVLDRKTDIYLGSRNSEKLGSGSSYTATESFDIPKGLSGDYYVFVVTDAGNAIREPEQETNNVAYAATPMQLVVTPPADLTVGTIDVPADGVAGEFAVIGYTVTNQGADPARGSWTDSVYLSKDDKWDVDDVLLAKVQHSGDVAKDGSYRETLTADLPGVVPGDYHVIVRSDIRNELTESNESNNLAVSADTVNVDAKLLALGTSATGNLAKGKAVYYRIEVGAGETLQVKLDGAAEAAANELYVSYGEMPTRSNFDYGFTKAFSADQNVVVPTTQAGTYYVLAYGNDTPQYEAGFSIEAKTLDFEIRSLSTNKGGNTGNVTVKISGAKFDAQTTAILRDTSGTELAASRVDIVDSTKLFATFELSGKEIGVYDLIAKNGTGSEALLQDGFTVLKGGSANVVANIIAPSATRPDAIVPVTIQFANAGNIDVASPLALLTSKGGAPVSFNRQDLINQGSQTRLEFVFKNRDTAFGTLSPGDTGSVTFYTKAVNSLDFSLSVLDNPSTPLRWDTYTENVANTISNRFDSPQQAETFWNILRTSIGETVGDLQQNILITQQQLLSLARNEKADLDGFSSQDSYPDVSLEDLYELAIFNASYVGRDMSTQRNINIASLDSSENIGFYSDLNNSNLLMLDDSRLFNFQQGNNASNAISKQFLLKESSFQNALFLGGNEKRSLLNGTDVYFNVWAGENGSRLENGTLDRKQDTYFIINGFRGTGGNPGNNFAPDLWIGKSARELWKKNKNANIILVDWQNGASYFGAVPSWLKALIPGIQFSPSLFYNSAAVTTQFVGDVVSEYLIEQKLDPSRITMIGYSLGAQVAGDAGEYLLKEKGQKINTIIGLDSAGPLFEGNGRSNKYTLDAADAETVVGIHTSRIFGYDSPYGHLDLYANPIRVSKDSPSLINYTPFPISYSHPDIEAEDALASFFYSAYPPIESHEYSHALFNKILEGNIDDPNTGDDPSTKKTLNWSTLRNRGNYSNDSSVTKGNIWNFHEKDFRPSVKLSQNSVKENTLNGTIIGLFDVQLPQPGYDYEINLTDDAGGRFRIENKNQLVVSNGSLLDYEILQEHTINLGISYFLNLDYGRITRSIKVETSDAIKPSIFNISVLDEPEEDPKNPEGGGSDGGTGGGGSSGGSGSNGGGNSGKNSNLFPEKDPPDVRKTISVLRPVDPNDIIGPKGFGERLSRILCKRSKILSIQETAPWPVSKKNRTALMTC